jgi:hypothetical protein
MCALGNVPFNQLFQRLVVHLTVCKRGDKRDVGPFEHGIASDLGGLTQAPDNREFIKTKRQTMLCIIELNNSGFQIGYYIR